MTENEVLFQISNLVNGRLSFEQALEKNRFPATTGGQWERAFSSKDQTPPDAAKVLDTFQQPYRSLYTVELRDGGEALGKVTLCFVSERFLGTLPQRLSEFVGEQLGMLLARTRLAARRDRHLAELSRIERDLASRKVLQRAEGILISQRGMSSADAKQWIAEQSHNTGLPHHDIADRVIAYYQATGLHTPPPWVKAHVDAQRIAS